MTTSAPSGVARAWLSSALSYAEQTVARTPFLGASQPPLVAALIAGAALAESIIDPDELEEHAYQQAKTKKEKTMGRSVTLIGQKFLIPAHNVPAALAAARALRPTRENSRGRTYTEDGFTGCHFSWTRQAVLQNADSLGSYLQEWGYGSVEDETGLRIDGSHVEKLGDAATLFAMLAPYAENGSYVEYLEGGDRWRFIIRNGRVHTETATISWNKE
jgi:hypothetical protein